MFVHQQQLRGLWHGHRGLHGADDDYGCGRRELQPDAADPGRRDDRAAAADQQQDDITTLRTEPGKSLHQQVKTFEAKERADETNNGLAGQIPFGKVLRIGRDRLEIVRVDPVEHRGDLVGGETAKALEFFEKNL